MLFALALALLQVPTPVAPDTTGALLTNAGVVRAGGQVDSVFVARTLDSTTVAAADWAAYLMARLNVHPIPETGLRIFIDARTLRLRGRIADLPVEARTTLSGFLAMLDPATPFEASVILDHPAPDAVRFHLDSASIGGIGIPDPILDPGLRLVGEKYPVLANGGRDLFVAIPAYATVRFTATGVVLLRPPRDPPPAPPSPPARRRPRSSP